MTKRFAMTSFDRFFAALVAVDRVRQVRRTAMGALFLLRLLLDGSTALNAEFRVRGEVFPTSSALLEDQDLLAALGTEFRLPLDRLAAAGA